VVLDGGPSTTIVAVNQRFSVSELRRHRLNVDLPLQMAKLSLHVHNTSATNGAFVGAPHMLFVALMMDTVTTLHKNYGLLRGKHVFAAYWTIAIRRPFDTAMGIFHFDR